MNTSHSDGLVVFGATGDLAYKKIFPALQAIVKRGNLDVPVRGVARSIWTSDHLRARARESIERHTKLDPGASDSPTGVLRYVSGDYNATDTFERIRKE